MQLRTILQICECRVCIDRILTVAELSLLAQQQDRHEQRGNRRRQYDRLPLL
jgi:hypothetical protein